MMSETKALAEENRRLKRMYAGTRQAKRLAEGSAWRKVTRPSLRNEMAVKSVVDCGVSVALDSRAFQISESSYRYERKLRDENAGITDWLEKLTENRRSWGVDLYFLYWRNVKGFGWNHKRADRISCELELNLRIKPSRRLKRDKPDAANHSWYMDFLADQFADGRSIHTLNRIIECWGKPQIIRAPSHGLKANHCRAAERPNMGIGGITATMKLKMVT